MSLRGGDCGGGGAGISQFLWGGGLENLVDGHWMWQDAGLTLHARARWVDEQGAVRTYGVMAFNQVLNSRSIGGGTHGAHFKRFRSTGPRCRKRLERGVIESQANRFTRLSGVVRESRCKLNGNRWDRR